jgi:hypothetical protein
MRTVKVPSKSNPRIYREVRIKEGLDGGLIYECSCPANVWYRVSNGRHGKPECSHIEFVKGKEVK